VADIVVRLTLHLPGPHREQRLGAIKRLNLRLLVYTEHESLIWRGEVEPDEIPDFFDERRIAGQLDALLRWGRMANVRCSD